jgi:hypothetical protein
MLTHVIGSLSLIVWLPIFFAFMSDANLATTLVMSTSGPLANKVKMAAMYARKNKSLG